MATSASPDPVTLLKQTKHVRKKADISDVELYGKVNARTLRRNITYRINRERRAVKENVTSEFKPFEFSEEDADTPYFVEDFDLMWVDEGVPLQVEIVHYIKIDTINVAPLEPFTERVREKISVDIQEYVESGGAKPLVYGQTQTPNQLFLVKWCPWDEIREYVVSFTKSAGKNKRDRIRLDLKNEIYDVMRHEKKWIGKWGRAFFRNVFSADRDTRRSDDDDLAWFCLVDIGKTILVPNKYVYHINGRLMIPPMQTFTISLILQGVRQYSEELHRVCNEIFKVRNQMRIIPIDTSDAKVTVAVPEDLNEDKLIQLKIKQLRDDRLQRHVKEWRELIEKDVKYEHSKIYKTFYKEDIEATFQRIKEEKLEDWRKEQKELERTPFPCPRGQGYVVINVPTEHITSQKGKSEKITTLI